MLGKTDKQKENGYIALSTVLIVLALVLLIGVSTALLSVNDLQSAISGKMANSSTDVVEACVEDVLMKLSKNNNISAGVVSLLDNTCSVTLNSHIGNVWDFTVSADVEGYYKAVRINVTRDVTIVVNNWNDV
ncbi:MAG: hypothetical protein UT39_C0018G0008 [Candidatus Woesebacteria bacterium GW2011_GWA1_39_21]|uniref:Type 4 fimbrial biogenesis protein PilX N-terminal domain-containing protein n=1 Tax=Candidatus Woesebacteria bacterium GW2011_GWA1_39_21 TaxID=1618550 RepID=A0A0G0QJD3_9BACT|nr:MAG: hypothetical protein UT39_C0018G0008 [Candidatus Woesebacteria bacterium GW2011_GWA1_39_21]